MDKFLARLHKKPVHHKKRFAFMTASTITLVIFGLWSLTTFGMKGGTVAEVKNEVSPFQSLRASVSGSLDNIKSSFGELKTSLESSDLEGKYKELKTGALNIYGQ